MSEKDTPSSDGTFQYYDAREVDEIHYKNARDEGAILRTLKTPEERAEFRTDAGTLKSIQIDLITLLKNKDSDTRLEFFVEFPYQGGFAAALSWVAPYIEFPQLSPQNFTLPPNTPYIMRYSDYVGSYFKIRIFPNGDDSWQFRAQVVLSFSTGSYRGTSVSQWTLSEPGSAEGNELKLFF